MWGWFLLIAFFYIWATLSCFYVCLFIFLVVVEGWKFFKNIIMLEIRSPAFPRICWYCCLFSDFPGVILFNSVFFAVWATAICAWLASGQNTWFDRDVCILVHFLHAPSVKFYPGFHLLFKKRLKVNQRWRIRASWSPFLPCTQSCTNTWPSRSPAICLSF